MESYKLDLELGFSQAVMKASGKRFTIEKQADPVDYWIWLLNTLHKDLTLGSTKTKSVITRCFQGRLEYTTLPKTSQASGAQNGSENEEGEKTSAAFLLLGLDLPPPPLFKDPQEKNIIPQVT